MLGAISWLEKVEVKYFQSAQIAPVFVGNNVCTCKHKGWQNLGLP